MKLVINVEKMGKAVEEVAVALLIVLAVGGQECGAPLKGLFWIGVLSIYIMYILYSFARMVFETWVCRRGSWRQSWKSMPGVVRKISILAQVVATAVVGIAVDPLLKSFKKLPTEESNPPLVLALTISVLYLPQVARKITSQRGSRSAIYRIILPLVAIAAMGVCMVFDVLNPVSGDIEDDDPRHYRFTKFAALLGTLLISIGSFVEWDVPMPERGRRVASAVIGMLLLAMSVLLAWRINLHQMLIEGLRTLTAPPSNGSSRFEYY